MQHIKGAGVILRNPSNNTVLLVQGGATHKWSFPKGELAGNESLIACAARETFEETSVAISIPERSTCVTFFPTAKRCYFLVDTTCIISNTVVDHMKTQDSREITRVRWMHLDEAKRFAQKKLVNRDVRAFLNQQKTTKYTWRFPHLHRTKPI